MSPVSGFSVVTASQKPLHPLSNDCTVMAANGSSTMMLSHSHAVPIAAGLLFPFFGILISPMFAAFAMSASSISVVLNALRLRTVRV